MFGVCPETKRCAGMGDRESTNPKEDSRKLGLVRGHDVEVGRGGGGGGGERHLNFFFEPFGGAYLPSPSGEPCWPRYFQSPLSECESRAVAIHFTQRKKTVFLIKRADDGEAAARAQGERGTGA